MSTSYNFKNNLTIDNNKFLNWLNSVGTGRINILGLNNSNDLFLNSGSGDIYINRSGNSTYINHDNSNPVIIASKLSIGNTDVASIFADLTLNKNSFIGLSSSTGSSDGYLGLSASHDLDTSNNSSRIMLYGNDTQSNLAGKLNLHAGNHTLGHINMYTGNDSLKFQIFNNGTINFSPDGSTVTFSITSSGNSMTTPLIIYDTTNNTSTNEGALQIRGGLSVNKNIIVGGNSFFNGSVLKIPSGDTSERPSEPIKGYIRYNTEVDTFEGYGTGNAWGAIGGGGGGFENGSDITVGNINITNSTNSMSFNNGIISNIYDVTTTPVTTLGNSYRYPESGFIETNVYENGYAINIYELGNLTGFKVINDLFVYNGTTRVHLLSNSFAGYTASASSTNQDAYSPFDGQGAPAYISWGTPSNYSGGVYTGSVSSVDINSNTYAGEWIQIQYPEAILLNTYKLNFRYITGFVILGSNNGSDWNLLDTQNIASSPYENTFTNDNLVSSSSYSYYRLVITNTSNSLAWMYEWELNYNEIIEDTTTQIRYTGNVPFINMYGTSGVVEFPINLYVKYIPVGGTIETIYSYTIQPSDTRPYAFDTGFIDKTFNIGDQIYFVVDYNGNTYPPGMFGMPGSPPRINLAISIKRMDGITPVQTINTTVPVITFNEDNIGIGTTTPSSKLDIVGDIKLDGNIFFPTATNLYNTLNTLGNSFTTGFSSTSGDVLTFEDYGSPLRFIYNNTKSYNGWICGSNKLLQYTGLMSPGLTSDTTIIDGKTYIASASGLSSYGPYEPYKAFDKSGDTYYHSLDSDYNDGQYVGSISLIADGTTYMGEWIQIQLPDPIVPNIFKIKRRTDDPNLIDGRTPTLFYILGSNDGSNWSHLKTVSITVYEGDYYNINFSGISTGYSYFRMIVNQVGFTGNSSRVSWQLSEWLLNEEPVASKEYYMRISNSHTFTGLWSSAVVKPQLLINDTLIYEGEESTISNNATMSIDTGYFYVNAQIGTIITLRLYTVSGNLYFDFFSKPTIQTHSIDFKENSPLALPLLTITAGNIGIGNTSPSHNLDINVITKISNSLKATSTNNTFGSLIMKNGNIGINTTTPSGYDITRSNLILDINGELNVRGNYLGRHLNYGTLHDADKSGTFSIGRWDGQDGYPNGYLNEVFCGLDLILGQFNESNINHSAIAFKTWGNSIATSKEAMRINHRSNVGIGTTAPSYRLDVQGGDINASGSVRSNGSALSSDRRVKENIIDSNTSDNLQHILDLRVRYYDYTQEFLDHTNRHDECNYGFIAQEVKEVIPNAVDIISNTLYKNIEIENPQLNEIGEPILDEENNPIITKTIERIPVREISDFHFLKKELIFTEAIGAIQELNKLLESEKQQHLQTKNRVELLEQFIRSKYPNEF